MSYPWYKLRKRNRIVPNGYKFLSSKKKKVQEY